MTRLLDVIAHLETQRQHSLTSAALVAKSKELHAEIQAQVEASMALIERARTLKWSMNGPTSPKWIDKLPMRKSISENKNG